MNSIISISLRYPAPVFAVGGHLSHLEIDVEDVASTLMEFSRRAVLPVHLHQDYLQRPPSRGCEIIGDDGKIADRFRALALMRYGRDGMLAETRRWEGFERNQLFLDETEPFPGLRQDAGKAGSDLADGAGACAWRWRPRSP